MYKMNAISPDGTMTYRWSGGEYADIFYADHPDDPVDVMNLVSIAVPGGYGATWETRSNALSAVLDNPAMFADLVYTHYAEMSAEFVRSKWDYLKSLRPS